MPYNSGTEVYERDPLHVADDSPSADTVRQGVMDNNAAIDDIYTDLEHHRQHEKHGVSGSVVGTTDTQTLTNKTLTTPTIADLTNMQHDHSSAANGGALVGLPASSLGAVLIADATAEEMRATLELGSAATSDVEDFAESGHTHAYSELTGKPTLGTAASENTGTTNGTIPVIGSGDKLSTDLLDTGTGANQMVKLDGTGALPAVSGANLTGIDVGPTVFISSLLAITNGGYHRDIAHGLEALPHMIIGELECISSDENAGTGYLPLGALVAIPLGIYESGSSALSGVSVDFTDTVINVSYAQTMVINYKRHNSSVLQLDISKFNLRIRAVRF